MNDGPQEIVPGRLYIAIDLGAFAKLRDMGCPAPEKHDTDCDGYLCPARFAGLKTVADVVRDISRSQTRAGDR